PLRSDTKAPANSTANTAVSSASHRCGIFVPFARQALCAWSRSVMRKNAICLRLSRQYAVDVVGVDFSAPDGERQVAEAVGIEPGAQTAVEHENAAAPVGLRVEQFAVD